MYDKVNYKSQRSRDDADVILSNTCPKCWLEQSYKKLKNGRIEIVMLHTKREMER